MDNFIDIVKNKNNDELLKMVYEFEEWSPEMLISVGEELTKRNILPNDIKSRKQELIEMEDAQLSIGKEASIIGQVIGWVTILGFLGIFIGYHYAYSKIRNKFTGKQYFRYNESSRKHGTYLFYSAIALLSLGILYKLLRLHPI